MRISRLKSAILHFRDTVTSKDDMAQNGDRLPSIKSKLEKAGQSQLLQFESQLNEVERNALYDDIEVLACFIFVWLSDRSIVFGFRLHKKDPRPNCRYDQDLHTIFIL